MTLIFCWKIFFQILYGKTESNPVFDSLRNKKSLYPV